jgi:hypothetical protein
MQAVDREGQIYMFNADYEYVITYWNLGRSAYAGLRCPHLLLEGDPDEPAYYLNWQVWAMRAGWRWACEEGVDGDNMLPGFVDDGFCSRRRHLDPEYTLFELCECGPVRGKRAPTRSVHEQSKLLSHIRSIFTFQNSILNVLLLTFAF